MGWQAIVAFLVAALVAIPLVPIGIWLFGRLPPSFALGRWAQEQRWPRHWVMQAIKDNAAAPFKRTHWHWAAVLALLAAQS